jgi:phosphoglycerate dehydrogenase-like enzyme
MKVLIILQRRFELWDCPEWFEQNLHRDFPGIEIVRRLNYEGIEEYLRDAEVALTHSLLPEQLARAKKLRWIHSPSAAVHQFMFPEFVNRDILLTNGSEVHGPVVAEHVLALMFALAKNLPAAVRFQQKHEWAQKEMWLKGARPRELAWGTLGLIGLGAIGREVARLAASFGMKVAAIRANPEKPKPYGVEKVFPPEKIDDLLAMSDYVVLAAPVTEATHHLMNADRLAAMKPSAFLINVGRGTLVDESALLEALKWKRIAAAALDVFEEEPLPPESPLWTLDNLLITPHTAGFSEKMWERQYAFFTENLRRYLAGQPLLALVDKKSGY